MIPSDLAQSRGDVMREIQDLKRQMQELRAERRLEAATIGAGGIIIKDGSVRVVDNTDADRAQLGKLPDGEYGLEVIDDDGKRVKLHTLAFGMDAVGDSTPGTRTGTTPNTYVWGDLAGGTAVGPEKTVLIGSTGRALVFWSFEFVLLGPFANGTGAWCSVELSGANTVAADAMWAAGLTRNPVPAESIRLALGRHKVFKGLNPGLTTITMKYAVFGVAGGTPSCDFLDREIAVLPY